MDTLLFAFLTQGVGIFIFAHAANVPDGVGWEHVRGSAGGVLGATASDKFGVAVLDKVVIDGHVFGFRKDRVIEFEVILFEHSIVAVAELISIFEAT